MNSNTIEIEPSFADTLCVIHARLKKHAVDWAITGSLGFALQGVLVRVNDIDLQTNAEGAYLIEQAFAEFSTKKVKLRTSEQIQSHYGALEIEGVSVEIMGAMQTRPQGGEWEPPVDIKEHRCWVEYNQMHLPVLNLAYEYQAYLKLGRVEKAHLLEKYIRKSI